MNCEWCDRSEEEHEGQECPDALVATLKRVPSWARGAVERLIAEKQAGHVDTNSNGGRATLQMLALQLLPEGVELDEDDDPVELVQELLGDAVGLTGLFEALDEALRGGPVSPQAHPYILAVRHLQLTATHAYNQVVGQGPAQTQAGEPASVSAPEEAPPEPSALPVPTGLQPCPLCRGAKTVHDTPCPVCVDSTGQPCGSVFVQPEEALQVAAG